MFAKCQLCGKTVFTLFRSVQTCPQCGNALSDSSAKAESKLEFPQRENFSLEDDLKRQLTQSYEGGGIGTSTIFGSWGDFLTKRRFDAPYYTALNNRACILVHFSSQLLTSEKQLEEILNPKVRLPLQIETFLGGNFPVIRCSLVIPDDPTNPFVLEAGLNILDGDVQDFCRAVLEDEHVDFIVKLEEAQGGRYHSIGYHAPGLSRVMEREIKRALRALQPASTRRDFIASSKKMETVFPTATVGVEPRKCIALTVSGKARNEMMQYGDFAETANDDPLREHMIRADAHFESGNVDAAISEYTQAVNLDPKFVDAYNNRGLAYHKKGDLDAALKDFNKAIALNPKCVDAYDSRGGIYREKGNLDAAIADFTQAITLNSKRATTYANRGNARYEKGELDASLSDFDTAIQLDPNFVGAYLGLGVAHTKINNLESAIKDFEQALQLDPNNPQSEAIKQEISILKVSRHAEDIIRAHLDRMARLYKKQPGFTITDAVSKRLLQTEVLSFTLKAMTDKLQESFQNNRHHWQSRRFGDLCLIVSVVPALDAAKARTYFQGKYLPFTEDQLKVLGGEFGQVNFAHWVLCSDGNKMGVHLTIIPAAQGGMLLFAQEMLTEKEQVDLGLL
jgi:tetratricopeptide (TPR) repeat protein